MSTVLPTKHKLFINRMTENQEQAKWGFEILLKRHDFADFFDYLTEANLFSPEHNSGPVPTEEPGFVRIPYWSALDYLEAVAKLAGDNNDLQLAEKVINIIQSVTNYRDPDGSIRDNYHTYRKFAEIVGFIPTVAVTPEVLGLIPIWLNSRYDRGMVGRALDLGALRRLLASESDEDGQKACTILRYCTAILWVDEEGLGRDRKKPVSVVQDYWLKELIKHHANAFGIKAGKEATQILCGRVREVFGEEFGDLPTYLSRPAVEDHPQNHSWDGAYNCFVEGLRDVLLSWIDSKPEGATAFVAESLEDENEMVRRVGIYVLGQRWSVLKSLYGKILGPQLFDSRNIHELYNLLKERFVEFSESDKAATLMAIRELSPPRNYEDADRLLKHTQRGWLSAIAGKGYEPVDNWFMELDSDQSLGRLSEHPDFHSYMESWSGPGPSPYSVQELLAFAEDESLIKRLNSFQDTNAWRGPSTEALVKSLEETVATDPERFLRLLPAFLDVKRPYQYGIINGFKRLWDVPKEKQPNLDWNLAWERLIGFFEELLSSPNFWREEIVCREDLTPTRDWIPPIIAEFLQAGTKDDDRAFSSELLPRAFLLIKILLEKSEAVDDAADDAMTQAINSPKGKAIEALFTHTLRECRVSDKEHGDHSEIWDVIKPIFDAELAKCENANYEFSTLAGAYLANINYISRNWLQGNIDKIFPKDLQANFLCAMNGLGYAPANRSIYALLLDHGVLDKALRLEPMDGQTRKRIIERIALAYLWRDESLESPRFHYLFESSRFEDLKEASRFFWSVSEQGLEENQIESILCFWERCVSLAQAVAEPPQSLLSELSRLTCYITTLTDRERNLMLAVAAYVKVGYNADDFINELNRLVEQDPVHVSSVLGRVLEAYEPDFDYQDRLKNLLISLAESGRRKDALLYADRLRRLPGFDQLFKKISENRIGCSA